MEAMRRAAHVIPYLDALDPADRDRLAAAARRFLADKRFELPQPLALNDRDRWLIALEACLPVLELGIEWYDDWHSVVVYPDAFVVPMEVTDENGVVHSGEDVHIGECWAGGPLVLAWSAVTERAFGRAGRVVLHELAHKLDGRNGATNGMPPLHRGMDRRQWTAAFSAAFEDLRARLAARRSVCLDPYAAESPAEFFAVAMETFFVIPDQLHTCYPDVYRQLVLFCRQDPARAMGKRP